MTVSDNSSGFLKRFNPAKYRMTGLNPVRITVPQIRGMLRGEGHGNATGFEIPVLKNIPNRTDQECET